MAQRRIPLQDKFMSIIDIFKNLISRKENYSCVKMMNTQGYSGFSYDGRYYKSDVVRSCIRPFANAIGKLEPKHIIRDKDGNITGQSDFYITDLLENPNPFMSGQDLLEKIANQLKLNNNAFVRIYRDVNGLATALYPINAYSIRKKFTENGHLQIEFMLKNCKSEFVDYGDLIHIRNDFTDDDDILGESPAETFTDLMNVVKSGDAAIVSAVKNGGLINWLLKVTGTYKSDHLKKQAEKFEQSYLQDGSKVIATDAQAEVQQITPHDYVPNASLQDRAVKRIYAYFGVNENIVTAKYSEEEWQAFFETSLEPIVKKLSKEFTRKILRPIDRFNGQEIVFSANSLSFANMTTKLNLLQMVDRGAMTPNEWRQTLNLPAIEGGDKPIRRLDTAVVNDKEVKTNNEE